MRQLFPQFAYKAGENAWYGQLSPDEGSLIYNLKIEYRPGTAPRVWVSSPDLHPKAPHRYAEGCLCLYYPRHGEWHPGLAIAATIVPWAAEWLFYYEVWLEDPRGRWFGPEDPHGDKRERPR